MASLLAWLPDAQTVRVDLAYVPTADADQLLHRTTWMGMGMRWHVAGPSDAGTGSFSAAHWTRATALHWELPLAAVAAYLVAIPLLQWAVARRGPFNVKGVTFWWNAGLSLFSCCGAAACVPVLLGSLLEHGLYFSTCAPAAYYATGVSGAFVALFVYSKIAELLDTVLLALAGKPIIALQWWHHSTVLLYCWHSYATRIATGAWFACMNYVVHAVMYGYFAATGTKHRRTVAPYAKCITILQLSQMIVGMLVTVRAVLYQAAGAECHVNKTNSLLGLAMYASYFVLFLKLFVENYHLKVQGPNKAAKSTVAQLVRAAGRQLMWTRLDQGCHAAERRSPERQPAFSTKKEC